MTNDIKKFLAEINDFRGNWNCINYNILSSLHGDIEIILVSYFWLDIAAIECNEKQLGEALKYYTGKIEISKLESLLNDISNGQFSIGEQQFSLLKAIQPEIEIALPDRLRFSSYGMKFHSYARKDHFEFACCYMHGIAMNIVEIVKDGDGYSLDYLDKCLRRLEHPYEGFEDFITHEMNLQKPRSDLDRGILVDPASFVSIAAPIPIRITDNTSLHDGILKIELCAEEKWNVCNVSVGITCHAVGSDTIRKTIPIGDFETNVGGNNILYEKTLKIEAAFKATVLLRQSNSPVLLREYCDHRPTSGDARSMIFNYINPINKGSLPWKNLEAAIGIMFHLAGFDVGNYGFLGETNDEDIDIIAFLPNSNKIIALECTAQAPDNKEKLQKFSRRLTALRDMLPKYEIVPVLTTGFSGNQIYAGDMENARRSGMVVLTEADTKQLYEKICAGEKAESVFFELRGKLKPGNALDG